MEVWAIGLIFLAVGAVASVFWTFPAVRQWNNYKEVSIFKWFMAAVSWFVLVGGIIVTIWGLCIL